MQTSTALDELNRIDAAFEQHGATAASALVQRALLADPHCVALLFRQAMMDMKQDRTHSAQLYAGRAAEVAGDARTDEACWLAPGAIKFAQDQTAAAAREAGPATRAAAAAAEMQAAAEAAAEAEAAAAEAAAAAAEAAAKADAAAVAAGAARDRASALAAAAQAKV